MTQLNEAFNKFYNSLNLNNKLLTRYKDVLVEADHFSKGGPLKSTNTKTFFHWTFAEKPAIFDVDFNYKIVFNTDAIKEDYPSELDSKEIDFDRFKFNVLRKYFMERQVLNKAKEITLPGFEPIYCIFGTESDIKNLNPNKKTKYQFSHTITIHAVDKNKNYKKEEIQKIAQEFVNKAEKTIFNSTKYFKITK